MLSIFLIYKESLNMPPCEWRSQQSWLQSFCVYEGCIHGAKYPKISWQFFKSNVTSQSLDTRPWTFAAFPKVVFHVASPAQLSMAQLSLPTPNTSQQIGDLSPSKQPQPPQKKVVRSLAADPTDESYPLSMNLSKGFKNTCISVYAFSNENMIFSTIKF